MLLTELEAGTTLLVKSYYYDKKAYGETEVSFRTTCTQIFSKGILTDEMTSEEGNPINFESDKVCSDVYLLREGESPIVWHNVYIKRLMLKGKRIHCIVSKLVGSKFNRRSSFRLSVGAKTVARLGSNRKTADVHVKDVSQSGFSIVTDIENEVHQYDYVRVAFDDFGYRLALSGICVRCQSTGDHRVIYGCTLDTQAENLSEYMAEKQRYIAQKSARH